MARLAAVEKALFYPTPASVIELIAESVNWGVKPSSTPAILDICAGDGAVSRLGEAWEMETYGVELDSGRSATAARKMTKCINGSYHCLSTEDKFSVLFLNPPYDRGQEEDGVSTRQEVQFLAAGMEYLTSNGLLVFIPPRHILKNSEFQRIIRRHFDKIEVFRFPSPLDEAFDQVVVFANKNSYYSYGHFEADEELPVLGETMYLGGEPIHRPWVYPVNKFALKGTDPEEMAPLWAGDPSGAYVSAQWKLLMARDDTAANRPLLAPRAGHQAMLLASGTLNGTELDGNLLLKGSSEKITTKVENEAAATISDRERIVSRLSLLNLITGEFDSWRVDEESDKTAQWFETHGETLAKAIQRELTPVFDGDLTKYEGSFSKLRAPGILPGRDEPELLPLQKVAAAACVVGWKTEKSIVLDGEMGTGKTTIAILACEAAGPKKTVVICPTHLVRKWTRECETITGQKGIARTAATVTDVDDFFADQKARYLILSKERAKLGSRWKGVAPTKRVIRTNEVRVKKDTDSWYGYDYEMKTVRETLLAVYCPDCGTVQESHGFFEEPSKFEKTQMYCFNEDCRSPMWQYVPISAKGTTRWPLAKYINQRYARRFRLVTDEAHQYAGSDTDQSRAIQHLISAATRVVAMTGTLYGGRASSLFHLLYKLNATFRQLYKYTECSRFVAHHGLFETTYKVEDYTSVYGYKRGNTGGRIKEIPGMNPAMVGLLLPYTIFVKLKDLRLELPPYSEEVVLIDHRSDVLSAVTKLGRDVKSVIREYPKALGAYLMSCLGYPDRPDQEERIMAENADGAMVEIARAPAFEPSIWPKDTWLADICQEEKALDRKVLVYFSQTHRRDARGRIQDLLVSRGLKVAVLDSNVPPEKREEWLSKELEKGFDVLLTNGRLVETGLDLIFAATVIQFGTEYSLNTLRQSVRRSWRLGQRQPVRVIFAGYRATMQDTALNLIARKQRAAEMVDGDDLGGLAQYDDGGTNFLAELAQEAVNRVNNATVRRTFTLDATP